MKTKNKNFYNIKRLKTRINIYGFNYKYSDFLIETIVICTLVVLIAIFSQLEEKYVIFVLFVTLMMIPLLIRSWFEQLYNVNRFKMLTEYLNNALPIFIQKPKIIYALSELKEITVGAINKSICKALDYLNNTKDDPNLERNALNIIEGDFNNTRIKSIHRFMLNVEKTDSNNYQVEADNLYKDVEGWIKRTYLFQKDLKDRRVKLVILAFMSLGMNLIFINIYKINDFFSGFTENKIYQLCTTGFISLTILTITIIMVKLNGKWLIDDGQKLDDKQLKKYYTKYKNGYRKLKLTDAVFLLIFLILAALCVYVRVYYLIIYIAFLFLFVLFNDRLKCKLAYKKLCRHFQIEFPLWVREVSLSLNNLTVINSIQNCISSQSYPMKKEIKKFLNVVRKNPTSIVPYNDFLDEYIIDDAKSTMRTLYSLYGVSKKDVTIRVSNLNSSNQEMLAKSENIKNMDSLSGIEAVGYIPMILVCVQLIVSMIVMFGYIMDKFGTNAFV